MTRMIEYDGISCAVYTTAKTEVDPGGPDLPPDTVLYAAWRWLYRCRALYRPLTALCLAFRRELVRDSSCRLAVSLPARAAGLPDARRLHLLLVLSREGVWLRRVVFSPRLTLPGPARRVVFR
ncbi:MAG TPA: hypothetical protein H9795_03955 [Candidatus Fournierella merdigallinarum]|nr:hypothetical protein [Candidatus Fournierella merdigallinarum]